jgi:hypothetical protein
MKLTFTASDIDETEMMVFVSIASLIDEERHLTVDSSDIHLLLAYLDGDLPTIVNSQCGDGIDGTYGWRKVAQMMRYLAERIESDITTPRPPAQEADHA